MTPMEMIQAQSEPSRNANYGINKVSKKKNEFSTGGMEEQRKMINSSCNREEMFAAA